MPDVTCAICAEPWDVWGAKTGEGDLTRQEYRQLVAGTGCPACGGRPLCQCGHAHAYHIGMLVPESRRCRVGGTPCDCACYRAEAREFTEAWASGVADSGEVAEDLERLQARSGSQ